MQDILEQLDGHFDNLVLAATNSHAALDQIAATTTTEQCVDIKAALENLASAATNKPAPRSKPRNTNPLPPTKKRVMEKWILILQSSVNNKWKVGGFCSTHGHGAHAVHDSGNCADKKYVGNTGGHDVNATRPNPLGPGKDFKKGWDAWLL